MMKNRRHPFARRTWLSDVEALERYLHGTEQMTREEIETWIKRKRYQRLEPEEGGPDLPETEAT